MPKTESDFVKLVEYVDGGGVQMRRQGELAGSQVWIGLYRVMHPFADGLTMVW